MSAKWPKTGLRLAAVAGLGIVLSACSESEIGIDSESDAGPEQRVQVSGKAVKGLVANGLVQLYGFTAGEPTLLGSDVTAADGGYDLDVPSSYSGPIKVVISAIDGSQMRCDAPAGCGDVSYGEWMPLEPGFSLQAYQSHVLPNQPVNLHVTPFTHLAAALVEVGDADAQSISSANAQIADLFDLAGNFTALEPVDVTQSAAVDEASQPALRYAVLAAAFAGGDTARMTTRLQDYATALVNQSGQLYQGSSAGGVPTLNDILQAAQAVAQELDSAVLAAEFETAAAALSDDTLTAAAGSAANPDLNLLLQAALDDAERLSGMLSEEALQAYIQSQIGQLGWVVNQELLNTLMASMGVVKEVLVATFAHDLLVDIADEQGIADLSALAGTQSSLSIRYDTNTSQLRYQTLEGMSVQGQTIDFTIDITPINNGVLLGDLVYTLKSGGSLSNSAFDVAFTEDSAIRFVFEQQDDFSALQVAFRGLLGLESQSIMQSNPIIMACYQESTVQAEADGNPNLVMIYTIDCVAADFLTGLDASGYLDFTMLVSNAANSSEQFDIDFHGFGDVNFTNPDAATVARLEIQSGHLYAPNGDAIYTIDASKGLVLNLGNSNNSMYARFGVESALIPTTHVTVRGQFQDLQDYLDLLNGSPLSFDFNQLGISNMLNHPIATAVEALNAFLQEGALENFVGYLLTETSPEDYVDSMDITLDVQPDELWDERRYDISFADNVVQLSNQSGVTFTFSAEEGAIVSTVGAYGSDLLSVVVTEQGTTVTDIEDAVALDMDSLPVEQMVQLYSRLSFLIGLPEDLQQLLDNYAVN